MDLTKLIDMSRRYGSDENYVLAGGGNTSYKEGAGAESGAAAVMAVKASGGALGTIDEDGFVLMDVGKMRAMTNADYPESDDEREACAIKDMMDARLPGQGEKRPSVECILHAIFSQSYVLHVHPAIINGLTCGREGAGAVTRLFADKEKELLWVPLTKPGYILSKACADAFESHRSEYGVYPSILLLQNHGIFIAADTTDEIDAVMADVVSRIRVTVSRDPDFSDAAFAAFPDGAQKGTFVCSGAEVSDVPGGADGGVDASAIEGVASALKAAYGEGGSAFASFQRYGEILRLTESKDAAAPLMQPFTPDHIVYDKAYPLWIPREAIGSHDDIGALFCAFAESAGFKPKVALVEGQGAFTLGSSSYEADTAAALLMDAVRVATYSEAFGGPLALPQDFTQFILNWEIESYRQKKSFG